MKKKEVKKLNKVLKQLSEDLDYCVDGYYSNMGQKSVQKLLDYLIELELIPCSTKI